MGHLRTIEIETGKGLGLAEACRKLGITEQTSDRWKKAYGGLRVDQAKRLKGLEPVGRWGWAAPRTIAREWIGRAAMRR